jgi:predicted nucleotidyltransferase component of viral defense system
LGHFLAILYSIPVLRSQLVFKGGTCLRKCWFSDYRFSEDLDFTAISPEFELTDQHLSGISEKLWAHAGIRSHIVSLKALRYHDKLTGYEAVIKYWGADHSKNEVPPPPERWQSKIKVEIILFEKMIFDPTERALYHPYSDSLLGNKPIPCYDIHEVLSEKIRALIQRSYTAPRDYYDIWYLSGHTPNLDWDSIVRAFHEKMRYKGLEFRGVDQLINPRNERAVKMAWRNSLSHQIPTDAFPDFDTVKKELEDLFLKVFNS